ncbi:MAG: hypothetical protein ACI8WB_006151 [Phenylobacterium sp.]|jgi:hypothetical protein
MPEKPDMPENSQAPRWFMITVILAVLWNLLGVLAFVGQMMMTPEMLAELPQAQQDLYTATPTWANMAFGLAVFGGTLGCLALLIKKSWALHLLVISLGAVGVQMFHAFFMSNSFEVFGPGGLIMPVMVVTVAIALIWLTIKAKREQWIG